MIARMVRPHTLRALPCGATHSSLRVTGSDTHTVTVAPNVDHVLMIALVAIKDRVAEQEALDTQAAEKEAFEAVQVLRIGLQESSGER